MASLLTACHLDVARAWHVARSLAVLVVVRKHLRNSAPAFVSVLHGHKETHKERQNIWYN